MRSAGFTLRLGGIGVVCLAAVAHAQTPAYRLDQWTADDGLPSTFISDIAQTGDGYLWLAAGGNLVRFDGFEFRVFNGGTDPAITARVNELYAGIGDTVWMALDNRAILSMANGRIAPVAGLPTGSFGTGLAQDARGRLLVIGSVIRRRSGDGFEQLAAPQGWALQSPYAWRDAAGDAWALGVGGALLRITARGAEVAGHTAATSLTIYPARRQVLLARHRGALMEVVDVTGVVLAAYPWRPGTSPLLVDRAGRLWVDDVARHAVEVYGPASTTPEERIALPGAASVGRALEDRSGNIWLAGTGLFRIQAVPFRTLGRAAGLPGGQIRAVTRGPHGSVLTMQAQAPLGTYQVTGDRARAWFREFARMRMDRRGTVWLSTATGGVRGLREGQPPVAWPRRGTFSLVMADDPARPGAAWFAADNALYYGEPYAPGGARVTDSVIFSGYPRHLAVSEEGVLWFASEDSDGQQRLRRYDHGVLRTFTRADGLPPVAVRAIVPDSGGVVWLGTYGAGLVRLTNGRFEAVHEHDGLGEDVVSEILDDGAGNFWMAGNRTVHRVPRAEVVAFLEGRTARVHGVSYGRRDGMTDPETSGDHGARSDDGRLWFPTFGGAAVVDPARAIALDSAPPIAHVLGIRTTGDTLLPPGTERLPRGQRRLAIAYTAVDLRNPAGLRFEYRLDGVDAAWIYAGSGRVAVYNDVGPGRHTFHVRAVNVGGVWSAADAVLAFSVPHYFHETVPFYLLVASLLAAAAWFAATARVRQLRRRQAELRALVDARTAELGQALVTVEAQADQLRSLDEAKSRFFANVSHEFRTPLSLILGPLEDVRDGRAGPLPELARKRLDSVMANGRRLVQLVEQLLDVARLESGTLQLNAEVRDLVPLLRRISESFASLAERRGLGFRVSCPVGGIRVRYDQDQIEKVITNLLGNALKFTPAGGRVELRAQTEGENAAGWAVVEVEDTGPGIPAAHLPRVFDRFYQVDDSPRRAHEGAGIGLALAKELVDLHGGALSVRSEVGTGSTFVVRLPLATGEGRATAEPDAPSPLLETRAASAVGSVLATRGTGVEAGEAGDDVTTVLVAEDNAELLGYLREHLEDQYRVIEAGNGALALSLAREHVPDLIVSDVMMPELDGQALCAAIKSDPETDFIPVILLTAKASRESRLKGLEGGADDYLAKPVDMRELLVRAANLITSRRRLKERYQEAQRDLPTLKVPLAAAPRGVTSENFIHKLYAAIAAHVGDETFEAEALAAAMAMSRSTLYRRVETELQRSPMDVLRDYRLEQAAQWLIETDANVSEVAYAVGFKSVPHFCAKFRERYGRTPSAYRLAAPNAAGRAADRTSSA